MKKLFIPSLFTLIAFSLLMALGTWQVKRLFWKQDIINTIEQRKNDTAITLPDNLSLNDPETIQEIDYRNTQVTGTYLHEKEMHFYGSSPKVQGKPGYFIVTPLKRGNGEYILINRGWVPHKRKTSDTRLETLTTETVTIEGLIRVPPEPNQFTPENNLDDNLWFKFDSDAMKTFTGQSLPIMVISARTEFPKTAELPIPIDLTESIHNDHLEYAITWYALALTLLVIFWIYAHRILKKS